MPTIKVNTNQLSSYESDMQSVLSRVNSIMNQFNSVSRNLDWDIKAESNINSRLSGISRELSAESRGISGMKSYLGKARTKYNAVESKNSGKKLKNETTGRGSGARVASKNGKVSRTGYSEAGRPGASLSAVDPNATYVTGDIESGKSLFGTVAKGAVLTGATSATKWFFGHKGEVSAEGSVIGGEIKTSSKGTWDTKKGEISAEAKVSADGYVAKGKASASYGLASLAASGTVGAVGASGKIGATLFKNGKLSPSIGASAKAEATAAKGDVKANFGTDENNVHAKASGQVLTAEASAKANVGKIEYEDSSGNTHTGYGVEAEVGAEAYVAKGSISGGITLFGIDIDVSVEGKAGGAGAKAGGNITNSSASGEIGLGLLVGLGAKVDVDWSDFALFN